MSLDIRASLQQELESFKTPPTKEVGPAPKVGDRAPHSDKIVFPSPKPVLVVFLRHCGCPFAEKVFKSLTTFANRHPDVRCIAVSHSSQDATDKWVVSVGGQWEVDVVVDPDRDLYAQWGLGLSSTWYAMNPIALYSAFRLGKDEGIWNRATESGSRWQIGGAFACDRLGFVRWVKVATTVNDVPDFQEALKALEPKVGSP